MLNGIEYEDIMKSLNEVGKIFDIKTEEGS